jgi:hypothetical protein
MQPAIDWHQVVGNCKTETSAKPVPMDSYKAEDRRDRGTSGTLLQRYEPAA